MSELNDEVDNSLLRYSWKGLTVIFPLYNNIIQVFSTRQELHSKSRFRPHFCGPRGSARFVGTATLQARPVPVSDNPNLHS